MSSSSSPKRSSKKHHHHHHNSHKYPKSVAGEAPAYSEIVNFSGFNDFMKEKAHSVANGYDSSQASVRASPEYEILELVNQFRERSLFPRLKFKSSLSELAIDKALGNEIDIEHGDHSFTVVSTMHFTEQYFGESSQELILCKQTCYSPVQKSSLHLPV